MIRAPGVALLAAALALTCVSLWIVLPAPTRRLLPLAVGAPELSAWLLVAALSVSAVAGARFRHGAVGRTALALAAAATLIAAVTLLRVPFAIRRFDAGMRATFGDDVLRAERTGRDAPMRPSPVVLSQLFLGLPAGEARILRGVRFATPGGVALTVDIYRPKSPGRYPVIVQIYGGAWQRGAPGDNAIMATYLAAHGFAVFAIDYRHAPAWQWPSQLEDVRAALAWIGAHAAEYDADSSRLALIGRSSGAQLAMVAAYEPGAPPIAAVVSLYGPVDLVDGYRTPPVPDPLDVRSIERAFLGGTPDEAPDRYRTASPVSYVSRQLPPSLLIYGARDNVVLPRFGADLARSLRAAGGTALFLEIPWGGHGFDAVANGLSGQLSLYYTERFLWWAFAGYRAS